MLEMRLKEFMAKPQRRYQRRYSDSENEEQHEFTTEFLDASHDYGNRGWPTLLSTTSHPGLSPFRSVRLGFGFGWARGEASRRPNGARVWFSNICRDAVERAATINIV